METEEGGKRLLKNLTGTNIALGEFGRNTGILEVGLRPVMAFRSSWGSK